MDERIGHQERGRRISESGNKLENWFEGYLLRYIQEYDGDNTTFLKNIGSLDKLCFKRHVDLGLSEYGVHAVERSPREGMQYADFVIGGLKKFPKGLRIECKRQDTQGSADEKLPYTVLNINRAKMPSIIAWVGTGWKNGAMERTAAQVPKSKFLVGVHEMEVVKDMLVKLFAQ